MKDFIDNIDWNKNIIFLILYMSIIVLCVYIYLTPVMDSYKSAIMEYRKTNVLESQLDSALNNLQKQQEVFLSENIEVFKRLQTLPKQEEIHAYMMKYLRNVKVAELGVSGDEIKIHRFKITGRTTNIINIKNLITDISTLEASAKITFPLSIRKDKKTLFVEMEVEVYTKSTLQSEILIIENAS